MATTRPPAPPGSCSSYLRACRGGMSLEFVVWFPVFVATLFASIDASFFFMTHTQMWNAARATARNMAVGTLADQRQAEAFALQFLPSRASFTVTTDFDYGGGRMMLRIAGDADEIGIFGIMSALSGRELVATLVVQGETPDLPTEKSPAI